MQRQFLYRRRSAIGCRGTGLRSIRHAPRRAIAVRLFRRGLAGYVAIGIMSFRYLKPDGNTWLQIYPAIWRTIALFADPIPMLHEEMLG